MLTSKLKYKYRLTAMIKSDVGKNDLIAINSKVKEIISEQDCIILEQSDLSSVVAKPVAHSKNSLIKSAYFFDCYFLTPINKTQDRLNNISFKIKNIPAIFKQLILRISHNDNNLKYLSKHKGFVKN